MRAHSSGGLQSLPCQTPETQLSLSPRVTDKQAVRINQSAAGQKPGVALCPHTPGGPAAQGCPAGVGAWGPRARAKELDGVLGHELYLHQACAQ